MDQGLSPEEFCARNNVSAETFEKADIRWETLLEIAADHGRESNHLQDSAEYFAKTIQKFDGVHSVRWRVKDTQHLLEKIIRKRAEGNAKYSDITPNNYFERVTDLVGIRALHLFKETCFDIDTAIRASWTPTEEPIAYIRNGDSESLKTRFQEEHFDVRNHPAGYRSVHYVISSTPRKRTIFAEIQVRTIFEEGWSEIDHKIRYPNFSDNRLVQYFLEIFNRMAGSADDMGGFVLGLVATLKEMDEEILASKNAKESTLKEMEHALAQLEKAKRQDHASRESIASLKKELEKLRKVNHPYSRGLNTLAAVQNFQNAHMQSLNDMARMAEKRLNQQNEAWREATKGLLNPARHGLLAGGLLDVPSGPKKDKPEN